MTKQEIQDIIRILVCTAIMIAVITALFWAVVELPYISAEKNWGDGYCPTCHDHWDFIGTDGRNHFMYACRWCYNTFWLDEYRGDFYKNPLTE